VGGRHNDPETVVVLCLNHHWLATHGQLDVGALPKGEALSLLERLILWFKSVGSFFELFAKSCYRFAAGLSLFVAYLEIHVEGWRHFPGMQ
jgi:hypothetical protein